MPAKGFSNGANNGFSSHGWSEVFINVVDNAGELSYKDGDVLVVKNRPQIRAANAQTLSRWWKEGFTNDGLRPDGLAKAVQNKTYEFRFERVANDLVNKIRTADDVLIATYGSPGSVGPGPEPHNPDGHMYVDEFVRRRIKHHRHRIFGVAGSEIWYGGSENWISTDNLDFCWNEIETRTPELESNHPDWPATPIEKRTFLCARISNTTDQEAADMMEQEIGVASEESVSVVSIQNNVPSAGQHTVVLSAEPTLEIYTHFYDDVATEAFLISEKTGATLIVRNNTLGDSPQLGGASPTVQWVREIKARKNTLPWRDFRDISPYVSNILNRSVEVDIRPIIPKVVHQLALQQKP